MHDLAAASTVVELRFRLRHNEQMNVLHVGSSAFYCPTTAVQGLGSLSHFEVLPISSEPSDRCRTGCRDEVATRDHYQTTTFIKTARSECEQQSAAAS